MKRNTILLTVLALVGLVAVWWFMLRDKASAATTDDLGNVLDGSSATSSNLTDTDSTDLVGSVKSLVATLTGMTTPASSTTSSQAASPSLTWVKTPQGATNLWTNVATGKQATLVKGHNPNIVSTLTGSDYATLGQVLSTGASTSAPASTNPNTMKLTSDESARNAPVMGPFRPGTVTTGGAALSLASNLSNKLIN